MIKNNISALYKEETLAAQSIVQVAKGILMFLFKLIKLFTWKIQVNVLVLLKLPSSRICGMSDAHLKQHLYNQLMMGMYNGKNNRTYDKVRLYLFVTSLVSLCTCDAHTQVIV